MLVGREYHRNLALCEFLGADAVKHLVIVELVVLCYGGMVPGWPGPGTYAALAELLLYL